VDLLHELMTTWLDAADGDVSVVEQHLQYPFAILDLESVRMPILLDVATKFRQE
jgi:hypothetical protein